MTDTMQTTLESFTKGDEITFNDRVQPLTVTRVRVSDYSSREVSVYVEGPRGGVYRLSASDSEHKDPKVVRVEDRCSVSRNVSFTDETELEEVELIASGAEVEPPVEVGDQFKKQTTLECTNHTGEWWGYEVVSVDREDHVVEIAYVHVPESSTASAWVTHKEFDYLELEDRLESWEAVDDLERDEDAAPNRDVETGEFLEDDEEDDVEVSNAHASRVARQLAMAEDEEIETDGGVDEATDEDVSEAIESIEDDREIVADGGVSEGDEVSVSYTLEVGPRKGSRHSVEGSIDAARGDEVSVSWGFDSSRKEILVDGDRVYAGGTLVGTDAEIRRLATDGGIVSDDPRAEWCADCQRYRVSCSHSRTVSADGGSDTTNMSRGARSDMADYTARAEELAEETSLTEAESRVAALKEEGLSHSEIAEEVDLSKSTVDEYSRRIRRRITESRRTTEELGELVD